MSDRESFNQAGSVFHFTSQLSSAKIRKYRLATERGMGPPGNASQATTSIPPSGSASRSNSTHSQEPPAKKPRLRLNVRKQSNDGDTIAVSRPKRSSTGRSRYSEEAVESDGEVEEVKGKQSPADSSALSSLDSMSVNDESTESNAKRGGQRESYGDFMSYYIMDGDDAEDEPSSKPSKPEPFKEKPATKAKQRRRAKVKQAETPAAPTPPTLPAANVKPQVISQTSKMPPPRQTSRSNPAPQHMPVQKPALPPVPHPQARPPPATPPPNTPAPRPAPPQEPPIMEEIKVKFHAPVPDKVKKLQALSAALTNFGGVPPTKKTPEPEKELNKAKPSKMTKAGKSLQMGVSRSSLTATGKVPIDNFLAMFDDDDSDSKDEADSESPVEEPRYLEHTGEPDGPLTYGIQFIMNALKSWAQQRLHQQQLAAMQQGQMPPPPIPSNGSGGPSVANPTPMNQLDLTDTPEGQAIAAFRDVVESGCLTVNVVMPADLASAVRHLYVQIDHLINQGGKTQSEHWECMSYSAQIEAHGYRVKRWKDQQMRAQEEMARQQQYAQYQMMQVGGQPIYDGRSHHAQFQQSHHPTECRRSTPHGQSSSRHPPRVSLPANPGGPSPQSFGTPPTTRPGHGPYDIPGGRTGHQDGFAVAHTDNVSLLMANLLPRSGQTMKFSFAPSNEAAIQAFGAGAFPAISQDQRPNLPNRGPMSASPLPNVPTVPSNAPERPRLKSDDQHARPSSSHREVNSTEAHAHPAQTSRPTSGFTAVNARSKSSHDTRRSFSMEERKSSKAPQPEAVVLDD